MRRDVLSVVAAGMGALTLGGASTQDAEPGTAEPAKRDQSEIPALPQIRLLADLIVDWQMDIGRLDPGSGVSRDLGSELWVLD